MGYLRNTASTAKFSSSHPGCEIFTPLERLPAAPGTYVLVLRNARKRRQRVGSLGEQSFERGWYLYLGSALGPGGLRARVGRHLRGQGRRHWHVDALRALARPREVWYTESVERRELQWYQELGNTPGLDEAIPGFGASDSAAATHLFFSPRRPDWRLLAARIAADQSTVLRRLRLR